MNSWFLKVNPCHPEPVEGGQGVVLRQAQHDTLILFGGGFGRLLQNVTIC